MTNLLADTKLAIELEKKGFEFYTRTAANTKNALAASVLQSLAEREELHIKRIVEFFQQLSGVKNLKSEWLAEVEVSPTMAELIKPILARLKEGLARQSSANGDMNEAYKIAEGLERDSYTLYEKIAAETEDQTAKKFYSALAQEEREHYSILDETLEFLNHPGEWYRDKERWIVEGG